MKPVPRETPLDVANYPVAPPELTLEQVHVYVRHGKSKVDDPRPRSGRAFYYASSAHRIVQARERLSGYD